MIMLNCLCLQSNYFRFIGHQRNNKLGSFIVSCHSVFVSDYVHMKILPELLLDSTGSVHFFMSKKLVFANGSILCEQNMSYLLARNTVKK